MTPQMPLVLVVPPIFLPLPSSSVPFPTQVSSSSLPLPLHNYTLFPPPWENFPSPLVPYSIHNHFVYIVCSMSIEGLTILICLMFSFIFILGISICLLSFDNFIHLCTESQSFSPPYFNVSVLHLFLNPFSTKYLSCLLLIQYIDFELSKIVCKGLDRKLFAGTWVTYPLLYH